MYRSLNVKIRRQFKTVTTTTYLVRHLTPQGTIEYNLGRVFLKKSHVVQESIVHSLSKINRNLNVTDVLRLYRYCLILHKPSGEVSSRLILIDNVVVLFIILTLYQLRTNSTIYPYDSYPEKYSLICYYS